MNITHRPSPNRNTGRQGHRPDIVVCHITEGAIQGTLDWISPRPGETIAQYHARVPAERRVSYHFTVSRLGIITQHVDITDTAWANGTTTGADNRGNRHSRIAAVRDRNVNANLYTVSIGFEGRLNEMQGDLTPAQLGAAVLLIRYIDEVLTQLYDVVIPFDREHIVGHADIAPRWKPNCPGGRFPFDGIIEKLLEVDEMRLESVLDMPENLQPEMRRLIEEGSIRGTGRRLPNGELELNILESVALSAIVASRVVDSRVGG